MKPTKRAKRMEKYLSERLGWETKSGAKVCSKGCGFEHFSSLNFCANCGGQMVRDKHRDAETFSQLEEAIAYALGETA